MKKLLVTVIGSAVAFAASAELGPGVWFNEFARGTNTVDELVASSGSYWSELENSTNTYVVEAMGTYTTGAGFPKEEWDNPTNALSVKTTFGKPLTFKANTAGTGEDIGAGLYFDSLVKFTVCEEIPTEAYDGAKIVMWLQEQYAADGETVTGTNLMVKAGYLSVDNGVVISTPTNYVCSNTIPGDFASGWHRVTIKSIANITTSSSKDVPGFAIYLDGATLIAKTGTAAAKWDGTFDFTLTEAAGYLDGDLLGALFPSLIQEGNDVSVSKTKIASISFDGTGALNELLFTSTPPTFAEDYVAPQAEVTIDGEPYLGIKTLAQAVAAENGAAANKTAILKLKKGMTLDAPIAFEGEATIILDFAGYVLTNEVADAVITNAAASFIVTNSVGNGGIYSEILNGKAIYQTDSGEIAIAGGNFWVEDAVTVADGYVGAAKFISGGAFADNMGLVDRLVDGKAFADDPNPATGLYDVIDYIAPTYTVKFVSGIAGQTTNTYDNLSAGADMPTPPDASIAGSTYEWSPEVASTVTADATYTAVYTAEKYTIKFVYGLDKETTNTVDNLTYYESVSVPVDSTNIVGYTATWTPTIENGAVTVTHDETFEATYTPNVYTITFVPGENASVDPVSTNYTIESGEITLPTATMNSGYVGPQFDGWTNETYTTKQTTFTPLAGNLGDFTFYAKWTAGGPTYPSYIDSTDTTIRNQYNAWAEANNVTNGDGLEAFFLLNVAPGGLTPVFSSTEIAISGTTVTIDVSHGNVNGYPYYKAAATVAGLATAQPVSIPITPADQVQGLDNGGRITLPGQSGEAAFYQIGISATPIPTSNP